MKNSFNRFVVIVGVGVLFALLLAMSFVRSMADRAVFQSFRFVLPQASAYAVTGPLRDLWANGPAHISRVYSSAASERGKKLVADFRKSLSDQCISPDELSDLNTLGIDGTRGAALTFLERGVVVAIPVADRTRLLNFVMRLSPARLQLDGGDNNLRDGTTDSARVLKEIRIDNSLIRGVVRCRDGATQNLRLDSGTVLPPNGDGVLTFEVSFTELAAALQVRCTAIFQDGSTGSCRCRVVGGNCSKELAVLVEMDARLRAGDLVELSSDIGLYLREDTLIVVSGSPGSQQEIAEGVGRTESNFAFFRGDDSLRSVIAHLSEIERKDDGAIVGGFLAPYLPFAGRAHFEVAVGPDQLKGRLLFPWQTLQSNLLEQVSAPPPQRTNNPSHNLTDDAEFRINDPWFGYYLRFINGYSDWSQVYLRKFGSFRAFIEELTKLDAVGEFRVGIRGVREGVPDVVVSLDVDPKRAESLIAAQRVRMRLVRDQEVLWGAAQKFRSQHPDEELSDIGQLEPYLDVEPLGERYTMAAGVKWDRPEWIRKAFKPTSDPSAEEFLASDYVAVHGRWLFQYLPPPVGVNDLAYRLSEDGEEKDIEALKAGRYRLAAYIDRQNERLLLGSNAEALADLLAPSDVRAPPPTPGDDLSKASIVGDPKYLINQGLIYPDEDTNAFVKKYLLDFEQYRLMNVRITPLPTQRGISATIVLSHER